MSLRRRHSGFTLVELLIAMAVFAVMAGIAYGGLSSVLASRDSISAALDRSKTLQMAAWRLQRDVEEIVDRPIRDRFGDTEPAILGSADLGLTFTRDGWSNPLGETRSTLQRVHYQLNNDKQLVRSYWRVLDQAQDSNTVDSVVLDGVESVEWRFLDGQNQWQDRWPPNGNFNRNGFASSGTANGNTAGNNDAGPVASGQQPPQAIELRMNTDTWGQLRFLFMIPGGRPSANNAGANGLSNSPGGR